MEQREFIPKLIYLNKIILAHILLKIFNIINVQIKFNNYKNNFNRKINHKNKIFKNKIEFIKIESII